MPPPLRRADQQDAPAAAALILEAAPGLQLVFGDRAGALRAAEACYRADRTELAHRFGLVAEDQGDLAGLIVAFPGRQFGSLKLGTGVVLARAAGTAHVAALVRRGRVMDRLMPRAPDADLYVSVLSVDPERRRKGLATALMERAIAGAARLGLGVTLDVGMENEGARRLYEGLGFDVVSVRETTTAERKQIPTPGMLRMHRPR